MNTFKTNESLYDITNVAGKNPTVHSLDHTNCVSSPIVGHSHRQPTLSYLPATLEPLNSSKEYRGYFFHSGVLL